MIVYVVIKTWGGLHGGKLSELHGKKITSEYRLPQSSAAWEYLVSPPVVYSSGIPSVSPSRLQPWNTLVILRMLDTSRRCNANVVINLNTL